MFRRVCSSKVDVDVRVVVWGDAHLLGPEVLLATNAELLPYQFEEPRMLPFAAHKVIADNSDFYDWFVYSEDDLLVSDIDQLIAKQRLFREAFGEGRLLLPNRFEINLEGPSIKTYIDGPLRAAFIEPLLGLVKDDQAELQMQFAGSTVRLERARNPHSGFFMLSQEQAKKWIKAPHFLDLDCSFVSPLESAATLSLMKSFSIYKSIGDSMNFFEIEHLDTKFSGMKLPVEL